MVRHSSSDTLCGGSVVEWGGRVLRYTKALARLADSRLPWRCIRRLLISLLPLALVSAAHGASDSADQQFSNLFCQSGAFGISRESRRIHKITIVEKASCNSSLTHDSGTAVRAIYRLACGHAINQHGSLFGHPGQVGHCQYGYHPVGYYIAHAAPGVAEAEPACTGTEMA